MKGVIRPLALSANLALLALIFYLGTEDGGPNVQSLPGKDKLGHALAFGLLAITQLWGLRAFSLGSPRLQPFIAVGAATTLGGVLELVQIALPTRTAEWLDLLADLGGAMAFVAALSLAFPPRREPSSARN